MGEGEQRSSVVIRNKLLPQLNELCYKGSPDSLFLVLGQQVHWLFNGREERDSLFTSKSYTYRQEVLRDSMDLMFQAAFRHIYTTCTRGIIYARHERSGFSNMGGGGGEGSGEDAERRG